MKIKIGQRYFWRNSLGRIILLEVIDNNSKLTVEVISILYEGKNHIPHKIGQRISYFHKRDLVNWKYLKGQDKSK